MDNHVFHSSWTILYFNVMDNPVFQSPSCSSGYAEGGGLYALGLIHANHGQDITEYLLGQVLHLQEG